MDALFALIDRGRHWYRNAAIGCYACAGCVVAIVAWVSGRDFYKQGPMILVGILLLPAVIYHVWYRSLDWRTNAVLVALRIAPDEIDRAEVVRSSGFSSLSDDRSVVIERGTASIMLTYHKKDLRLLARLLTDHCRNIRLAGF